MSRAKLDGVDLALVGSALTLLGVAAVLDRQDRQAYAAARNSEPGAAPDAPGAASAPQRSNVDWVRHALRVEHVNLPGLGIVGIAGAALTGEIAGHVNPGLAGFAIGVIIVIVICLVLIFLSEDEHPVVHFPEVSKAMAEGLSTEQIQVLLRCASRRTYTPWACKRALARNTALLTCVAALGPAAVQVVNKVGPDVDPLEALVAACAR